jgi:hypothetical protein
MRPGLKAPRSLVVGGRVVGRVQRNPAQGTFSVRLSDYRIFEAATVGDLERRVQYEDLNLGELEEVPMNT